MQDVWGVSAGSVINTYANQTSGSIYYSFLLNTTTAPSASQYLTSLNPGTGAPNGSSDALQIDAAPNAGGYQVGIADGGTSKHHSRQFGFVVGHNVSDRGGIYFRDSRVGVALH